MAMDVCDKFGWNYPSAGLIMQSFEELDVNKDGKVD